MKVEGNLKSILSNYGFYVKLKSEDRRVSELEFRKNYTQSLIIEDSESVNEQINKIGFLEKRKIKESNDDLQSEEQNVKLEIQNNQGIKSTESLETESKELENQNELSFESDNSLEIKSEELETENGSSSSLEFLNAVREIQNRSKTEKLNDTEEVHGIFIDEWQPDNLEYNVKQEDYTEECTEECKEDGTDEDECTIEYKEHGVFIDDLKFVQPSSGYTEKNIPNSTEELVYDKELDDILDDLLNSVDEESESSETDTGEVGQQNLGDIVDDLSNNVEETEKGKIENKDTGQQQEEKQEVIVVPTNIRDFIKANQGSSMSYVLQYYSKKDISKAINLGRIYVKGGKLYI